MAEFTEVVKQAKRMCKQYKNTCEGCALYGEHDCLFQNDRVPEEKNLNFLADAEKIVMDWAAKHPEPRYPTWEEWQEANFPDALHSICPNFFMRRKPLGTCSISCEKCTGTPIPADIAEKLGVKPIGGEHDERASF